MTDANPDPPQMLSTAEEKFRTFLAAQNYPKPICWLMPGDVVARAHYIVTGNRKHFPAKWTDAQIVSARQFLDTMADIREESR